MDIRVRMRGGVVPGVLSLVLCGSMMGQSIQLFAGGSSNDGKSALVAGFGAYGGTTFDLDAEGNLFIPDGVGNSVGRVSAKTGVWETIAGTGAAGREGDDGPATLANLGAPISVALDGKGGLIIWHFRSPSLAFSGTIRRLDLKTGRITPVAGYGGDFGDDVPATSAILEGGLFSRDARGNIYITQGMASNWSSPVHPTFGFVRRIDANTGRINTVAGGGTQSIRDGLPAKSARFRTVGGIHGAADGSLYVSEFGGAPGGGIEAFILRIGSDGLIRIVARSSGETLDGVLATQTRMGVVPALFLDTDGSLLFADRLGEPVRDPATGELYYGINDSRIRRIDRASGIVTTVAGGRFDDPTLTSEDGAPFSKAFITLPGQILRDASGDLHYLGNYGIIRKVDREGRVRTIAGSGSEVSLDPASNPTSLRILPYGVEIDPAGAVNINVGRFSVCRLDPGTNRFAGCVDNPSFQNGGSWDFSFGPSGDLFFGSGSGDVAYRYPPGATSPEVVAGVPGSFGFGGDGGPATLAMFNGAYSVKADGMNNLYIVDSRNGRIRRVDLASGIVRTVAGNGEAGGAGDGGQATFASVNPGGSMAIDPAGNLLFVQSVSNGGELRKLDVARGTIDTITPYLFTMSAVDVDDAGRVFVAQEVRNFEVPGGVLQVDPVTGSVIADVVGGSAVTSGTGNGGPASRAKIEPSDIAIDKKGNLFLVDRSDNTVRVVRACVGLETPALLVPASGSSGIGTAAALEWSSVGGAFTYDVLLDTVNPPTQKVAEGITSAAFTTPALVPLTKYYWKIVARGDPFCAPTRRSESPVFEFTTEFVCQPPSRFDLQAPASAASNVPTSTSLSWQASARSARYNVYLGPANPAPIYASGVSETSFAVSGLTPGTTYYWNVEAESDCEEGRTTRSAVRSFRTAGTCPSPGALSTTAPANGASDLAASVTLEWTASPGAASYDVYFGTGTTPSLYARDVMTTDFTVRRLARGVSYRWRVVAKSACGAATQSSAEQAFSVRAACVAPDAPSITSVPPRELGIGLTYLVSWSDPTDLDEGGRYIVERSKDADFRGDIESQDVDGNGVTFVAEHVGSYWHRVVAVAGCDAAIRSSASAARSVQVGAGGVSVVFTELPRAIVAPLGVPLDGIRNEFTIENLGVEPATLLLGTQSVNGSPPFFSIYDPLAGDTNVFTLEPRSPRRLFIRYSGPDGGIAGSYDGFIRISALGQAMLNAPSANVSLRIGGRVGDYDAPKFVTRGIETSTVFFPGWAGDDSGRPPAKIELVNLGRAMELAAEVGPESWVRLERGWNSAPLAGSRQVSLFTARRLSPASGAYPRSTFLTVRNLDGDSARLLVVDNGDMPLVSGRAAIPGVAESSFVVPFVVSEVRADGGRRYSEIRLTNASEQAVQAEIVFTPADVGGFDTSKVLRTTLEIPPNDVASIGDPLGIVFGLPSPSSGWLEIRAARERKAALVVGASLIERTVSGKRTESSVPVLDWGAGARRGRPHVLAGITRDSELTTDLVLVETSGRDRARVKVDLFDSGATLSGSRAFDIPAYGQKRIADIAAVLGVATGSVRGGRLEIRVEEGEGTIVPTALFTSAGSPVALAVGREERSGGDRLEFLISGVSTGASSATSIVLTAASDEPTNFSLTFRTSAGQVRRAAVTLAPRTSVQYDRAVARLFGFSASDEIQGSIVASTPGAGAVWALQRTVRDGSISWEALPGSVVGEELATTTGGGSGRPLYVDGLEIASASIAGVKSSLVLNELGRGDATATVRLYESGNRRRPLAEKRFELLRGSELRLNDLAAELGLANDDRRKDYPNVLLLVSASGAGLVSATVQSTDAVTGDIVARELRASGGATSVTSRGGGSNRRGRPLRK